MFADDPSLDIAFIRTMGRFDERFYRSTYGLGPDQDAIEDYVMRGWRQGREPSRDFQSDFLMPFYEASGFSGPPFLTWLELIASGAPAPSNRQQADDLAGLIRNCELFDLAHYRKTIPAHIDPVLHYVVVGENLGVTPSAKFNPRYYRERYPDAGTTSLLHHFHQFGRYEGRNGVPVVDSIVFDPLPRNQKPALLILAHEASRTGAPLLALEIARRMAERYNVVSLLVRGGELEKDFRDISAAAISGPEFNHWNSHEIRWLVDRVVKIYSPHYAISNSIETHLLVRPLALSGIPVVSLVHEFAAYTRPLTKMSTIYEWASQVVFPARIVADSVSRAVPAELRNRSGISVQSQGPVVSAGPSKSADNSRQRESFLKLAEGCFVVLGVGSVQYRKGVDLFVRTAALVRQKSPETRFLFAWIGDGYDPVNETTFSVYLAEQITQENLGESFVILPPTEDLEFFYSRADAFFMCSRLDPQPNVGIDAIIRGLPVVCFENCSGTAETLKGNPQTEHLVVSYLDTDAAAVEFIRLARSKDRRALRNAIAGLGVKAYDMENYINVIDRFGREAAKPLADADVLLLVRERAVDSSMFQRETAEALLSPELEKRWLLTWPMFGYMEGTNTAMRRPIAGFHPQAYARAHANECGPGGTNPLVHWIRNGRQAGPWSRDVFTPDDAVTPSDRPPLKVALHCHFHYPEFASDLLRRLRANNSLADLFLTTNDERKAGFLRNAFRSYEGLLDVRIVPNRGRDIGPFLTDVLPRASQAGYDLVGHIHAKRSPTADAALGESWRNFLWENLIGGNVNMLDVAERVMATRPDIGLLIAEDPHLVAWDANREIAEDLAQRMGIALPLDDYFDFPLGTMFWTRPTALQPFLDLRLTWEDYPEEPVPLDGTMLHAIERLTTFVTRQSGYKTAGLRVPSTTW